MTHRTLTRTLLATAALAATAPAAQALSAFSPTTAQSLPATTQDFTFRHDFVLGTSMDLTVQTPDPIAAESCHRAVLAEIDRLSNILSTYDPSSTISRAKLTGTITDPDLAALLTHYATWHTRTNGIITPNLAPLIALWKSSAQSNTLPSDESLAKACPLQWCTFDPQTALPSQDLSQLNIDSLGKAYIIDRAVEIARTYTPSGLLNIGGDLRSWGPTPFLISITDPNNPAENAPPLATFALTNSAVATSGGYLRNVTIGSQKLSHLINPHTLRPISTHNSATVAAPDCLTANALSTAACILPPATATHLATQFGALNYLIIQSATTLSHNITFLTAPTHRDTGTPSSRIPGAPPVFHQPLSRNTGVPPVLEHPRATTPSLRNPLPAPLAAPAANPAIAWPKDHQVTIEIALKQMGGGKRYRRPYVAVWIEDAAGKPVRTITLWGNREKYVREMTTWWRATNGGKNLKGGYTAATRDPGKYSVTWNGLDDAGQPVPKGDYTIKVEINREHGGHITPTAKLPCTDKPATTKLEASNESDESTITYGPKK